MDSSRGTTWKDISIAVSLFTTEFSLDSRIFLRCKDFVLGATSPYKCVCVCVEGGGGGGGGGGGHSCYMQPWYTHLAKV